MPPSTPPEGFKHLRAYVAELQKLGIGTVASGDRGHYELFSQAWRDLREMLWAEQQAEPEKGLAKR